MPPSVFVYDVFLNFCSKDSPKANSISKKLQKDGIKVFVPNSNNIRNPTEDSNENAALEHSRSMIVLLSKSTYGNEWENIENNAFRFIDPENKGRRLIPIKLDNTEPKDSLKNFKSIDWRMGCRVKNYPLLLESCRPPKKKKRKPIKIDTEEITNNSILSACPDPEQKRILIGGAGGMLFLRDIHSPSQKKLLVGHRAHIWALEWSSDGKYFASAGGDAIRIWEAESGICTATLKSHRVDLSSISWSPDQKYIASGAGDGKIRLWDINQQTIIREFFSRNLGIWGISISPDQKYVLSGSRDHSVRIWDINNGKCLQILEGHTGEIRAVAWSKDQDFIASGGEDGTVRIWDVKKGIQIRVLEGHKNYVWSLSWNKNKRLILSGSSDKNVRLWDIETGKCIRLLSGHLDFVRSVSWSRDQNHAVTIDGLNEVKTWDLSGYIEKYSGSITSSPKFSTDHVRYTNAKVLLVGESGAGKTGLSKVLAGDTWQPSDSTVGAWATQWKLPVSSEDGAEREIWLWDFGGQADQRLIHQLYFEETASAILVFDGQKEDVFETLGQWDRDLARASSKGFSKLLVAGRVDAGAPRISRQQIEKFATERGFMHFVETSAKTGAGCATLRESIINSIVWDNIPWRSSPSLFRKLKDKILNIKDSGTVLMRYSELRGHLHLELLKDGLVFTDEELKSVIRLLSGPGVLWELKFGSWVLLQPEYINAYAQAVIQTMREDEHERGYITEEKVLSGNLTYRSSHPRLDNEQERFVLLEMHQTLVAQSLCLRQQTENGPVLIFPVYYRRERPDLVGHPAVLVNYTFDGFLDDIYTTLVVRLHHTSSFRHEQLWRYGADFRTLTNKQLGVKLTRRSEGAGELEVYFDPTIPMEEKIIFSKYIHEHLLQNSKNVVRLRHYICPHCGTHVGNREIAMKRLNEGKTDILCVNCDDPNKRVPLWDNMEELFSSNETIQKVKMMQEESENIIDSESKERLLVGEIISTVALSGHIAREFPVSDHGIDMEIEFKSKKKQASGKKVYLQLKSGDSYLRFRKRDKLEIFDIKNIRHVEYWKNQIAPVILIIRNSDGEIRWMEIRDYLRSQKKDSRIIVFSGKKLDARSVREWSQL